MKRHLLRAAVLLGIAGIFASVGGPAAVASYRHGVNVAHKYGETREMAEWLPLTTDGLLVAALVVMYWRRWQGERAGRMPVVAMLAGGVATLGANLAAADLTAIADPGEIAGRLLVAVWAPISFAFTLELVAIMLGFLRRIGPAVDTTWPVTHMIGIPDRPYVPPVDSNAEFVETIRTILAEAAAEQRPVRPRPVRSAPVVEPVRSEPVPPARPRPVRPGAAGRSGPWTDQDEAYRIELQNETDQTGAMPTARAIRGRYGIGPDRAKRIVGRIVPRSAERSAPEADRHPADRSVNGAVR